MQKTLQENEKNLKTGRNIFQITYLIKDLHWEHRKKLNNMKTSNSIRKWVKVLNKHLTKEDMWMINVYMERCSASLAIREMQIKAMSYHYIPIRMSQTKNTDREHAEQLELFHIIGRNSKMIWLLWNTVLQLFKIKSNYIRTIWPTYSTLGHFFPEKLEFKSIRKHVCWSLKQLYL